MPANYLAVFLLPKPQREHARIVDVIREASNGDFKAAFVGSGTVGYLFSSSLPPWKLDFGKVLMNDDAYLITEVGNAFSQARLGSAEGWLKAHAAR